ncbi:MAG: RimK family alpha-L-glutamate ligase [Bdellovibrionales bacterium]
MKIARISHFSAFNEGEFNSRIEEEFVRRGHSYVRIPPDEIRITFAQHEFPASHHEHNLAEFDLFDHALRGEDEWGWEVIACLRDWNKPVLRPARVPYADKVTMARLFARAGIVVPRTAIASDKAGAEAFIVQTGYPVIGKARLGSKGRNVRMLKDETELEAFIEFTHAIAPSFLLQEVIYPLGRDVRAFVVGNNVVACMERYAAEGDFRANYSLSKNASPTTLTPEEEKMVLAAADVYQVTYAGIDFIRTEKGPVVLEINKAPGVQGIEAVTGLNVAGAIVEYYEKMTKENAQ